ncbi:hypothetical protein PspLS_01104 [Pyricularia sp. CBS 133598]|nr:hypothetical protein PspLS_01104 [Pyricularia sp. CBS 133598]
MQSKVATILLAAGTVAALGDRNGPTAHGVGAMGTEMGPVAFLWPADRPWSAGADNTEPCGSTQGVGNRTPFPLSAGAVSLSIAADAYDVEFTMSYAKDPKSNSDFTQQAIPSSVDKIVSGHQCYKLNAPPSTVKAGDDATIQLKYRSKFPGENNGNDQTFYACADIQYVETSVFKTAIPCFNVTSDEFAAPETTNNPVVPAANSPSSAGLTTGAIAGIAVGTIVGSLAVVGVVAFLVFRKRRAGATRNADTVLPVSKCNMETARVLLEPELGIPRPARKVRLGSRGKRRRADVPDKDPCLKHALGQRLVRLGLDVLRRLVVHHPAVGTRNLLDRLQDLVVRQRAVVHVHALVRRQVRAAQDGHHGGGDGAQPRQTAAVVAAVDRRGLLCAQVAQQAVLDAPVEEDVVGDERVGQLRVRGRLALQQARELDLVGERQQAVRRGLRYVAAILGRQHALDARRDGRMHQVLLPRQAGRAHGANEGVLAAQGVGEGCHGGEVDDDFFVLAGVLARELARGADQRCHLEPGVD